MKTFSFFVFVLAASFFTGCSPLKTSPHDEKHQLELTLHEVQTNLDDLRHDVNSFQTEMQILDGRIRYYENSFIALKNQDLSLAQEKIAELTHLLHLLEKKIGGCEKAQQLEEKNLERLGQHANETTVALTQFKNRLHELEQETASFAKIKIHLESLAGSLAGASDVSKIYKVSAGDSLEKIAKMFKTSVQKLKETNDLHQDLIVVGQELKIPTG